jgi:hypothetical protein
MYDQFGSKAIWIDQICIDQNNLEERSNQVQIMGSIFQKAKQVVVWLGEEENDSDSGFELAKKILDLVVSDPSLFNLTANNLKKVGLPWWNDRSWRALGAIFLRPWFRRVWVIQEVVKAQNIILTCGAKTIPWEKLIHVLRWVHFGPKMETFGSFRTPKALTVQRVEAMERIRSQVSIGMPCDIFDLLNEFRTCDASDDRDKVFALVGLAACNIVPDYTRSLEWVFEDAATRILQVLLAKRAASDLEVSSNLFGVLYSAGTALQRYSLPSWVPDWSFKPITRPLWLGQSCIYRAGGQRLGNFHLASKSHIHLSGILFDTVNSRGAALNYKQDDAGAALSLWLAEANRIVTNLPELYHKQEPRKEAFKRTLIVDRAGGNPVYRKASAKDIDSYHRALRSSSSLRRMDYEMFWMSLEHERNEHGHEKRMEFWHESLLHESQGRCFFVTDKGFMGLGPSNTRKSDVVCVMLGGEIPVILREEGDGFKLIGECYVHGVMNGEVLQTNIPVQDICIK